ncbi:cytochrome c biogenesis protein CcsA [Flammeovirga yaeyamensis]|uniref:Cytochrome c biogenesis protein CcsA n=1 Tax=Flammeovirga yaeyamensis TaxID=367791 RepID=A0AAX1N9W5_9BACT|nr:cytochrome c biogenesis protein CcsA [Flammeovirga yaeyamensis]MBB3697349.1 cytochrome c-type biogenesis protein CcmF [Flammeovirga yaeyamensis]NMF36043.1 cytochrome c biogenesis protein CcsA [Flammeovirga yaeyamensis]QWG02778.1 cytochrome c biogenesis protein CcsA [Flammeovirga yaeyamensis]
MIHAFIGNFGHFMIIVAFVTAILSAIAYRFTATENNIEEKQRWKKLARATFIIHGIAVFSTVCTLFFMIFNHYYEYHYVWSHSSNNLPAYYIVSSFWEGQEGSFLVWTFWHVLIALFIIKKSGEWEYNVMFVVAAVQAFLMSMILGVTVFGAKIGSSPFILLRDAIEAPVFATNPNFIPEDGTGLNPLLQNIWMVIHPPTLFMGFALTLIPFAFVIAALFQKDYQGWVKPSMGWVVTAISVLGIGIMMGAYWAYETLNFGGYWNWDPVENAVYVPWLILVAGLHLMIIQHKSFAALKAGMGLILGAFILILYSTFLTRSGVLGEGSVHSFTDLGLSGQLLLYLVFFTILAILLFVARMKDMPSDKKEASTYSAEFWIFIGATVLALMSFQVLVPTSYPAFNALVANFGISSNLAPPADAVAFYTKFQLWFAVALALISGTAQFFFWKRLDKKNVFSTLTTPYIITLIITAVLILMGNVHQPTYIILLTAAIFSLVANTIVIVQFTKLKISISGGAVTHIGVALMLVGILASSGFEDVISLNMSGKIYNSEFPEEMNKENVLLFRGHPKRMGQYHLTYKGPRLTSRDIPGYFNKESVKQKANDPYHAVVLEDIVQDGETVAEIGDEIQIYNENIYYEIEYISDKGKSFSLFPRVQDNEAMGPIPSPDIKSFWNKDMYTHITNLAVSDDEVEWSKQDPLKIAIGDTVFLNDYVVVFDGVKPLEKAPGYHIKEDDYALQANLRVLLGANNNIDLKPSYVLTQVKRMSIDGLVNDYEAGLIAATNRELGLRITLKEILPKEKTFVFEAETAQKDWVIMKAVEKPFISILWIGTILLGVGTGISASRRFKESKNKTTKKETKEEVMV